MYSLHLTCNSEQIDFLSAELWDEGTTGIRELAEENSSVTLVANFDGESGNELLARFCLYSPRWVREAETNWVEATQQAWPGRAVGTSLFLAAPWCRTATPADCKRLIHNPGMASGTGEHPCTQLALEALERFIVPASKVADVGTGSGILAIAARLLGAASAIGIDADECALQTARENFALNNLQADLIAGSAECLRSEAFSIVAGNISASVLLSMADELLRINSPNGTYILTGFPQFERAVIEGIFPAQEILERDEWCCLISRSS